MSGKVNLSINITSSWGSGNSGGYGANIMITNNNSYEIMLYSLNITIPNGSTINWTNNFMVSNNVNNIITLTGQSWLKSLLPGQTFIESFGGNGIVPSQISFNQIDPPLIPVDPNIRGIIPVNGPIYTPYVDILAYPTFDIVSVAKATGHSFYTFAFITADQKGNPSWGGIVPLSSRYFIPQINQLRALGGDIIISFGGANGQEIAQTINDLNKLVAAYQIIIDLYSLKWIDFDIEGGAIAQKSSIDLRNQAITILQKNNVNLKVSYCLPVLPTGLTNDGLYVLQSAVKYGTRIDVLGVMSMDFGDNAFPPKNNTMGTACIQSAQNTYTQAKSLGLKTTIKIIPMIGVNDVQSEIFKLNDAQALLHFAQSTSYISGLSGWSVNRDIKGNATGNADASSSGILQNNYDFLNIFKTFKSNSVPTPLPIPSPPVLIPNWVSGQNYLVDNQVIYNGIQYICKRQHTSSEPCAPGASVWIRQ